MTNQSKHASKYAKVLCYDVVHAVAADGNAPDGSLYGFETLCGLTVLDNQESVRWIEIPRRALVTCKKCIEGTVGNRDTKPSVKLAEGSDVLALLKASSFVELHYTDSITNSPTSRIIPVGDSERRNSEYLREIIATRGAVVSLKNFKLRFNQVIAGKANITEVEFKDDGTFECPNCDGKGTYPENSEDDPGYHEYCYSCEGTGRLPMADKPLWIISLLEEKARAEKWLREVQAQLDKLAGDNSNADRGDVS